VTDAANTYLVEHYWPGVTPEVFREASERVRVSAEAMAVRGAHICCLHSTLVPKDEAAFCVFAASSAELVAEMYAHAGVTFERILDALEVR